MKIRILTAAFSDLQRGREFYDAQEAGVGDYFYDSVFSDIDSLVLYGGIHRVVYGYHRMLSKRFPYAIYYKMDGSNEAIVFRVLDCRSDPRKNRAELE